MAASLRYETTPASCGSSTVYSEETGMQNTATILKLLVPNHHSTSFRNDGCNILLTGLQVATHPYNQHSPQVLLYFPLHASLYLMSSKYEIYIKIETSINN